MPSALKSSLSSVWMAAPGGLVPKSRSGLPAATSQSLTFRSYSTAARVLPSPVSASRCFHFGAWSPAGLPTSLPVPVSHSRTALSRPVRASVLPSALRAMRLSMYKMGRATLPAAAGGAPPDTSNRRTSRPEAGSHTCARKSMLSVSRVVFSPGR